MNYRCFIALEAPSAAQSCLADRLRLLRSQPGVKWVEERNLHLTLLFLGDVDSVRVPEIESCIESCTADCRPFQLALRGLEIFPPRSPRLVWASLAQQDAQFFALHKELLGALRREGFTPDAKPLKLHITLGRIKHALPVSLEREILASALDTSVQAYDTLTLYRSVLKPEGPVYHVLKQYKLT